MISRAYTVFITKITKSTDFKQSQYDFFFYPRPLVFTYRASFKPYNFDRALNVKHPKVS